MYEATFPHPQRGHELWARVGQWLSDDYSFKRGLIFGIILAGALVAFEIFNFSTTEFALTDLLGEARFMGLQWATILAIAFCGIDFAGLARLFTPERKHPPSLEVWYLVGAWFLGATMNAMMTWWAVSLAMVDHTTGNEVLTRDELLTYVPIFVATLVWLTRILIIGTFSVAGERLFARAREVVQEARAMQPRPPARPASHASARHAPTQFGRSGPTRKQATPPSQRVAERRPKTRVERAQVIGSGTEHKSELRYEEFDADEAPRTPIRPPPKPRSTIRPGPGGKVNGAHK